MNLTIIGLLIFPVAGIFIAATPVYYYPAVFFLLKFAGSSILHFERVRYATAFQIAVMVVLIILAVVKDRRRLSLKDHCFLREAPYLLLFIMMYAALGLIRSNSVVQVLLDSYKYLEIFMFFVLMRVSFYNNSELFAGLKMMVILMLVLGIIEPFYRERGGVGLNMIMSLFPMAVFMAVKGYFKNYSLIIAISMFAVFVCQTRTYIVAFMMAFLYMMTLLSSKERRRVIIFTVLMAFAALLVIVLMDNSIFEATLSRFLELSSGFKVSGGYRVYDYKEALNRFIDHPIIGWGLGYLKPTYIELMGWMNWGDFVHCLYLEILFKTGITGIIYLMFISIRFISRINRYRLYYKNRNTFMYSMCAGSITAFAAWALTYTFAPLSTIGPMFLAPLIASTAISNDIRENMENE